MGGCVAKKTYIIARQDPTCKEFAKRFHSIFFLGTPHRGSKLAVILSYWVLLASGGKKYVRDLVPDSEVLSEINEEFYPFALDLRLWSFYETLPIGIAGLSQIVVNKESATLGYDHEEKSPLNADHRQVCKFATQRDPNYKSVRNALLTSIDLIREIGRRDPGTADPNSPFPGGPPSSMSELADEISRTGKFLDASSDLEDDFVTLQLLREPESCKWIAERHFFTCWKGGAVPRILWVNGRPGTGKSILSSYVVDQLQPPSFICSYFFFRHGIDGRTSLSDCLRSLLFQMAAQDISVRRCILQFEADEMAWDRRNEMSVWRNLITGCVGKLPSMSKHCWVLDGLDECKDSSSVFTKQILSSLPRGLRVFVTSRPLEQLQRGLAILDQRVHVHNLSDDDTSGDIGLFVQAKLKELGRPENASERNVLCQKILSKASGSFLWVRLIMQEFEKTWTRGSMEEVLEKVPMDLQEMYLRILKTVEESKTNAELAKVILRWVVLSSRPLSVDELCTAVRLDANQDLQNGIRAIPALCGNLVFVDQGNKVQIVHKTAREFLTSPTCKSEIIVVKAEDHSRQGIVLLRFLSGDALKRTRQTPMPVLRTRSRIKSSGNTVGLQDDILTNYAASHFSDHLRHAAGRNEELAKELSVFLESRNILTWIEYLAQKDDLGKIRTAAKNLRTYLDRRRRSVTQADRSVFLVDSWIIDLTRVCTKFGSQLLSCPSSIHTIIPPLCPLESAIQAFGAGGPRFPSLKVKGLSSTTWDDRISIIDFEGQQEKDAIAVVHGEQFFAVGFLNGHISVFDTTSAKRVDELTHPEKLQQLEMGPEDRYLVSSGKELIIVWDMKSGIQLHLLPLPGAALAINFLDPGEIIVATKSSHIITWDLETNDHLSVCWLTPGADGLLQQIPRMPPVCAAFLTTKFEILLAIGYPTYRESIVIIDALQLELLDRLPLIKNPRRMAFNQNPDIPVLLVNTDYGDLHLYNYDSMALESTQFNLCAASMSCSLDGRRLVTGGNDGSICVFEFHVDSADKHALRILYYIDTVRDAILATVFNSDGLQILETRRMQCRVWAPATLVRKDDELGSRRDATAVSCNRASELGAGKTYWRDKAPAVFSSAEISTPFATIRGHASIVIAGTQDGKIIAFSVDDATISKVLYQTTGPITALILAESPCTSLLITAQMATSILIFQISNAEKASRSDEDFLITSAHGDPRIKTESLSNKNLSASLLTKGRAGTPVHQLLANPAADRLYVRGYEHDELWELPSGRLVAIKPQSQYGDATAMPGVARSEFQHPENDSWFVVVIGDVAHILSWETFDNLSASDSSSGIKLDLKVDESPDADSSSVVCTARAPPATPSSRGMHSKVSYHNGPGVSLELLRRAPGEPQQIYVWLPSSLDPSHKGLASPAVNRRLTKVGPMVLDILGFFNQTTLVFLDTNLWVCSIELGSAQPDIYVPLQAYRSATLSRRESNFSSRTLVNDESFTMSSSSTASLSKTTAEQDHGVLRARRHFFALPEWRACQGELQCAMVTPNKQTPLGRSHGASPDFVFANGEGVVVVKSGLEFSELVTLETPSITAPDHSYEPWARPEGAEKQTWSDPSRAPQWKAVPGSTHRRAPGW
ncbi:hypothetical protein PpBr36_07275 [Pyricularia pennisetigena]|uniref:hypothetical protein n=1 Tax=Pyricularia pennisetigena TaxID=1578925 RepID=UPI00114F35CF|nr:hypothetical protein PpBr36_07275 [Pyricularia pennisetigena]TLS25676.1 hypothetical protein PpBr36_07275 [Pyricularia pennisetigena]